LVADLSAQAKALKAPVQILLCLGKFSRGFSLFFFPPRSKIHEPPGSWNWRRMPCRMRSRKEFFRSLSNGYFFGPLPPTFLRREFRAVHAPGSAPARPYNSAKNRGAGTLRFVARRGRKLLFFVERSGPRRFDHGHGCVDAELAPRPSQYPAARAQSAPRFSNCSATSRMASRFAFGGSWPRSFLSSRRSTD